MFRDPAGCPHGPARDAARRADAGQVGARDPRRRLRYEPKWDGFRSIVFRDGDEVVLGSRNERPLTRYFPEVVEAVLAQHAASGASLDGEIVVARGDRLDFEALQQRIHPAGQPGRTCWPRETPASFVAFDLLALGDDDLHGAPFAERRGRLGRGARATPTRRCT